MKKTKIFICFLCFILSIILLNIVDAVAVASESDSYKKYVEKEIDTNTNDRIPNAEYKDNPVKLPAKLIGTMQTKKTTDSDIWEIFIDIPGIYTITHKSHVDDSENYIYTGLNDGNGKHFTDIAYVESGMIKYNITEKGKYFLNVHNVNRKQSAIPNYSYEIIFFKDDSVPTRASNAEVNKNTQATSIYDKTIDSTKNSKGEKIITINRNNSYYNAKPISNASAFKYLIIPIILGLLYFAMWFAVGRDVPLTIVPLFYPPEGIDPGTARAIMKQTRDDICFSANVIDLSVKRYIELTGTTLMRTEKKIGDDITDIQGILLRELNPNKVIETTTDKETSTSERTEKNDILALATDTMNVIFEEMNKSKKQQSAEARLEHMDEHEHPLQSAFFIPLKHMKTVIEEYFTLNMLYFCLGSLPLLLYPLMFLFDKVGEKAFKHSTTAIFFCFLMVLEFSGGWGNITKSGRLLKALSIVKVIGLLIGITLLFSAIHKPYPLFGTFLIISSVLICCVMGYYARRLLPNYTHRGTKMLEQLEGFKLYLSTAEKYRIEMFAQKMEETPELFEKYLPWALAFDVADAWMSEFDDVLQKTNYELSKLACIKIAQTETANVSLKVLLSGSKFKK